MLAPVRFPDVDRGHRLDEVVRRHAVADRFRDVVVVADPATITLLLRVLAPDQLPASGPVTEVGLPRGAAPVPLGRAAAGGVWASPCVAGLLVRGRAGLGAAGAGAVVAGLVLLALPGRRWLGLSVLIAVAVALGVSLLAIAGSAQVPRRLVRRARTGQAGAPGATRAGVRRSTTTIAQTVSRSAEARATTPGQPAWVQAALPRLPKTDEPT